MSPATVCVGGPAHGCALTLPPTTQEVYPIVFIPPADDAPPGTEPEAHEYTPRRVQLFGRMVTVHWHTGTPFAYAGVAAAVFNKDGLALYDTGWGHGRPEPTGGGSLLLVPQGEPAEWREVDDVASPVAWRDRDGVPAAVVLKVPLLDRWVRLAVPAGPARRVRSAKKNSWLDAGAAQATLSNEALAAWETTEA